MIGKIEGGILPLGHDLRSIIPYIRNLLGSTQAMQPCRAWIPRSVGGSCSTPSGASSCKAESRAPGGGLRRRPLDGQGDRRVPHADRGQPAREPRVLVILTYRTGYSQPFGERSYQTRIVPGALSIEDSVAMARAMLAAERLPDGLQALLARKAEGNPFFVEEWSGRSGKRAASAATGRATC